MKKLMLVLTLVLTVMLCTGAAVAENTEILEMSLHCLKH